MNKRLTDIDKSEETFTAYKPVFFRLTLDKDKLELEKLLNDHKNLVIYNEISGQLKELIKLLNPTRKLQEADYDSLIEEHLKGVSMEEYGVWVYYPWSNRLAHILDEHEFIEVRTNRNQYKITPEEREKLSTQKIGVIGLSVGQSIALTLALERSFGELRIADYDVLELSNLNRIRSGLYNLNIKKTICVAREILEIDPYLNVTLFSDGITEDNIDDFFLRNGKLDLVVDECDGLDIKILCRYKAKELKIPVFMESSDRGTIDVERFDLESDRPILHGLIDHLDHKKLKYLKTNEEKIPYILPMLGTDTISKRMRASMVEIEQTITTWPQLASSVVFGGGIGADICRRIMLDQFHESGRYIVDMEELVGNKKHKNDVTTQMHFPSFPAITSENMEKTYKELSNRQANAKYLLSKEILFELIKAANLAPSVGNNQPWKWFYKDGFLLLFHDKSITISFGDYDEVGTNVTMGACIENLLLKSHQLGLHVDQDFFPIPEEPLLVAAFSFSEILPAQKQPTDYLVNYIEKRCTNRNNGKRISVGKPDIDALKNIAQTIPGATLHIIESDAELESIKNVIAGCDRLRFMHPEGHHDFFNKEIRWTKEECEKTGDGLDIASFDLTASEATGFKMASDPDVIKYLTIWKGGKAFEKLSRKAVDSASAVALVTMPAYDRKNYLLGGQCVERIWLEATKRNLSIQPMLAPLFLFTRLIHGNGENIPEKMSDELKELRKKFIDVFPIKENIGEIFLFKIAASSELHVKSLRKPVESVLTWIK